MNDFITEKELIQQLAIIKKTLDESKQNHFDNIAFLNNDAYYTFLKNLCCPNGETIGTLLNRLEHCIPFALTDDSFYYFISSVQSDDAQKMEALRHGFIESCKNDFLSLLLTISNEEQWQHIIKSCEMLRQKNRSHFFEKRKEQI